eukprot:g849.t1
MANALHQAEELQADAMDKALSQLLQQSAGARRISEKLHQELSTSEKMFHCLDTDMNGCFIFVYLVMHYMRISDLDRVPLVKPKYLGRQELRLFADTTGFQEDVDGVDWDTAYNDLCDAFTADPDLGLDLKNFNQLCEQYLEEEVYKESIDQFVSANYQSQKKTRSRGPKRNVNASRAASRNSSNGSRWSRSGSRRPSRCLEDTPDGDADWRSRRGSMCSVGRESVCSVGRESVCSAYSQSGRRLSNYGPGGKSDRRRSSVYSNASGRSTATKGGSKKGGSRKSSGGVGSHAYCMQNTKIGGQDGDKTPASRGTRNSQMLNSPHTLDKNEAAKNNMLNISPQFLDNKQEDKTLRKLKKAMRDVLKIDELHKAGEKIDALQEAKLKKKEELEKKIEKLQEEHDARKQMRRSIVSSSRRVSRALGSEYEYPEAGRKSRRSSFYNNPLQPNMNYPRSRSSQGLNSAAAEFVPQMTKEQQVWYDFKEAEANYFYMLQEANQRLMNAWRTNGYTAVESLNTYSADNPYAYMNRVKPYDPNHLIVKKQPVAGTAAWANVNAEEKMLNGADKKSLVVGAEDVAAINPKPVILGDDAEDVADEVTATSASAVHQTRTTRKSFSFNKNAANFTPAAGAGAAFGTMGLANPFMKSYYTMMETPLLQEDGAQHPCWAALPRASVRSTGGSASAAGDTNKQVDSGRKNAPWPRKSSVSDEKIAAIAKTISKDESAAILTGSAGKKTEPSRSSPSTSAAASASAPGPKKTSGKGKGKSKGSKDGKSAAAGNKDKDIKHKAKEQTPSAAPPAPSVAATKERKLSGVWAEKAEKAEKKKELVASKGTEKKSDSDKNEAVASISTSTSEKKA